MTPAKTRYWIPHFVRERHLREVLQSLYAATILSNHNAILLRDKDPDTITEDLISGNEMARGCMSGILRWLRLMKQFAASKELYERQILLPIQLTAGYIADMREASSRSTSIRGYVFTKSKPKYSRAYQEKITIVTILVPDLGVTMSLRHPSRELDAITYGWYDFGMVQPVPLVNRVHPTKLSFHAVPIQKSLRDHGFMRASISDAGRLARCWDFERSCQVESEQAGRRQLGYPCIVTGRLIAANGPRIILKSAASENKFVELVLTSSLVSQLGGDIGKVVRMKGKYVRVLAVVWYNAGVSEEHRILPEAFMIEGASDEVSAASEDLFGFIMWRGKVKRDRITRLFPLVSTPEGVLDSGEELEMKVVPPMGTVGFSRLMTELSVLRLSPETHESILGPSLLLNWNKLQSAGLAEYIARYNILPKLTKLIEIHDNEGALPDTWAGLTKLTGQENSAALYWLRDMGLLIKREQEATITDFGIDVAYTAYRDRIRSAIENAEVSAPVITLMDLRKSTGIPASLLLRGLKEAESNGLVECSRLHGQRFELFWTSREDESAAELRSEISRRLEVLSGFILEILGSEYYDFMTAKIAERLQKGGLDLTSFELGMLLQELKAEDILTHLPDGSWSYPWWRRMADFASARPDQYFAFAELLRGNSIPPADNIKAEIELEDAIRRKKISKIGEDQYTSYIGNPQERMSRFGRFLKFEVKRLVQTKLGPGTKLVSMSSLKFDVRCYIEDLKGVFQVELGKKWDPPSLTEEFIDEFLRDGFIVQNGIMCALGNSDAR